MPTVDDGESLSDVNKQFKPEMEVENLEVLGIESAEKCELNPELGELSVSVGGDRDETVSLEVNAVDDKEGKDAVLENHEAGREQQLIVEAVAEVADKPVVVTEDVVSEEDGGGMIASQVGDSSIQMKADKGTKRVNDAEGEAVVTDTGDISAPAESGGDDGGDELQPGPKLEKNAEDEFLPAVELDEKLVTESESLMDARRDEIPLDPQLVMITEKEFKSQIDPKIEVVNTDVGCEQQLSELQTDGSCGELNVVMEGTEDWKNEPEKELDDEQNVEPVGGVDTEPLETLAGKNEAKAVDGNQVNEEQVDVLVNDSEIGTTENPAGVEEEKVDSRIAEGIPTIEVKGNGDMVTDVNAVFHESVDGVEYLGQRCENAEDKDMAAEGSLTFGSKMGNDDNLSMEVLSGAELDERPNVSDYKEDVLVKEEVPAGDIKAETETGSELESTRRAVVEEVQSMDDEVETEIGTNFVSDKTSDEDGKLETEDTMSDVDEPGQDIYDSPAALQEEDDETMAVEEETETQDTEMETETDMAEPGKLSAGKRKRGKLSKGSSISKPTTKASSRKTVGDDVCFICFDGGELVLCDRRGCPKAYHPSCVNRDEAFFKSKGRWNCGWHLCSNNCEKNASYMCYTCTFSLCKSCIKDRVIFCVRGNKGFCEACKRTVMLIENNEQGSKDTQIDFDDKSSWEYLFKDYYLELKAKLSLSSDEIAEAKNPWKGAEISGPSKQESSEAQPDANDGGSGSDNSIENSESIKSKRRKTRKQSKSVSTKEELINTSAASADKAISLPDNSEWASKELLEFVAHMKDGDTSALSQFDVQALLLDYIKINKLRDPRRKSQIICDTRLENLFGKPRVGHFEMLKLLESHFLVRDEQNDDFQGSVVDTENNLDGDLTAESLSKGVKDRKRKYRRKGDSRGPQSNLDDYAAIDMHNIGLIYLRRKLMEDLLEDPETFHDKVIGTFVRIRISGTNQKQDLYRLVQVVGTSKAAEPYKVGKRTTDIMVEILNLDKTENISIDTISNQEFTEEECKRLRQSIKCGLISRLTVGEILDKTMEIQVARVNDWLESETLRLSHLRDRASDLGRRKELRECVEKLQLLKTPEERRRRLEEIPEIHADPKMDPSYESEENDTESEDARRDAFMRSRGSGFSRRGRGPISPGSDNSVKDSWSGAGKDTPSRNLSGSNFTINSSHIGEIVNENSWNLESHKETQEFKILDTQNFTTNSESAEWAQRNVTRSEPLSGVASVPLQGTNPAGAVEATVKINESEKMWHYQDPSGKVQGPFSMVQLRKWNNTGYFPANLKIWRTTGSKDNSILLTDALAGKIPKETQAAENTVPSTNNLHSLHTLAGHSGKISLHQERERSYMDQNSGSHSKLPGEKWPGNDITSLPSPTPIQSNSGLLTAAVQSTAVNMLPSPTAVLPSVGPHSSTPASVLSSVVQTPAFNPTPNSQQGIMVGPTVPLHTQSTTLSEPHIVQMPVQTVASQNLQADTQVWGNSIAQPGQPQGYGWASPNVQSSSGSFSNSGPAAGIQPDVWRATQSSQPNMQPQAAPNPNASWGMGPTENSAMGMRPQNPNIGWGTMPPVNPNMGWGNPPPGNANVNWGPPIQNASGWGPPPANTAANIQGMVPGNPNPAWVASQGWGAPPVQGPVPGNGWGPPSGNAGAPPAVQGPAPGQGGPNQGWAPWGGEQNQSSGQLSGPRGSQGRDSGFGGGRPWNRQSSFGGGGGGGRQSKRDTLCPYNANGRCRKGARCDYMHA